MIQLSYREDGALEWQRRPCYDELWYSKHTVPQTIHLWLRRDCDEGTRQTCAMFIDWLAQYAPISLHEQVVDDLFTDSKYSVTYATLRAEPEGNSCLYYTVLSLCRFLTTEYNSYLLKKASPQKIIERVFSMHFHHPLGLHIPAQDHTVFIPLAQKNISRVFDFYSYILANLPYKAFKGATYCTSGISSHDLRKWLSEHVIVDTNVIEKEQANA